MFKFIHAADIHLDSPLLGLQQYDGAPVDMIRGATRQALENLVELAVTEAVAFVLIVGDLYDGDWRDYNTGLFFSSQMSKLRAADIRVYIISGNHDAASQITKHLRMPDNVKILSHREPESVYLHDLEVVVHGQGFHSRAITANLAGSYPEATPHFFNIGMLHTCADGREGHEPYGPCALGDLLAKNYDYWALGHVHKREVLHKDPWILFPGNIQGRHVRETGPKGCTLVTVEDGKILSAEHKDLDVLRWSLCEVNVSDANTGENVIDRILVSLKQELEGSAGRPIAARIQLVGCCRAHEDLSVNVD